VVGDTPPPPSERSGDPPSGGGPCDGDEYIAVDPRRVTTEHHREAGPVHVGYQFWKRLGMTDILTALGMPSATQHLACAMILNRLIQPASEHAMPQWIRRTALADILGTNFDGLEEDPLYRVLDKLHPHRAAIEAALVERERSLFNLDRTIYLYDLTSTYFEGLAAANPKAQRGYSRDHRPDCKQVVIGLVVNRDASRSPMRCSPATPRACPGAGRGPHHAGDHARPAQSARRTARRQHCRGRSRHGRRLSSGGP